MSEPEDPRWEEVRKLRAAAEDCARAGNMLGAAWNDNAASILARKILADEATS